ncbi:TraV family lipoprotein [Vibrio crassostreae]|uniref:TraV family lipoprotein n=1 Tax=Vibrio crassostreae TaxID=246167 RepID=UPI000636978E|nr:TraV family lipoprotein [Vibrio crassostreae]CDT76396.1 conserved exported hypothetical protein [Vibrio crassostreae]
MKKILTTFITTIGFLSLTGCSFLPFNDESACVLEGNYGQCINGEQAYEEAVSGEEIFGNYIGEDGISDNEPGSIPANSESSNGELPIHNDKFSHVKDKSFIRLKDSVYNEIKQMVDQPVTPMLRPTKVVSTLVLNYQSNGDKTTMYGHRYVYSILKDSEFILNQYMLKSESTALGFLDSYSE